MDKLINSINVNYSLDRFEVTLKMKVSNYDSKVILSHIETILEYYIANNLFNQSMMIAIDSIPRENSDIYHAMLDRLAIEFKKDLQEALHDETTILRQFVSNLELALYKSENNL